MKVVAAMIIVVVASPIIHCTVASDINTSCNQSYEALADNVLTNDKNKFKLLQTFYPPNQTPPVFVIVMYEFENSTRNDTYTYFWTSRSSFFIQPLEVFEFMSLFLGSPSYLSRNLTIILPSECETANPEHLEMLTYLVR